VTCSSLNNNAFSYKIKFIGDNTSGNYCAYFFLSHVTFAPVLLEKMGKLEEEKSIEGTHFQLKLFHMVDLDYWEMYS
jgi:hypothetical protein